MRHGDRSSPKRLARQRRAARSEGHRPQDDVRGAAEARRRHSTGRLLRAPAGLTPGDAERRRAEAHAGVRPAAARDAARRLEDLSAVARCSISAAPSLSSAFVEEEFAFNGAFLNGAREMKPRWKRCVEVDRQPARRSARPQVRREVFPARGQGAHAGAGEEPAARDGGDDRRARLDERRRPRQRALEKLATFNPKIGYPDKWKDYSKVAVRRDAYWDTVARRRASSTCRTTCAHDRQAGRSRPLGHDAADLRRVLQPDAERDRLSRRASCSRRPSACRRSTP